MCEKEVPSARIGLSIETSGTFGSVAIGSGGNVIDAVEFATPRAHAVDFLPAIDLLFRSADHRPDEIQDIFVSIGPGSFTGLRIGVTAARMIAYATGARITAVPTLTAIAQNAGFEADPPNAAAVILDAKRKRVYASSFRRVSGSYVCQCEPAEVEPSSFFATQPPGCVVLGEGVNAHRAAVDASGLRVLPEATYRARAEVVFELGHAMARQGEKKDRRSIVPHYVRLPEAEERWAQRHSC